MKGKAMLLSRYNTFSKLDDEIIIENIKPCPSLCLRVCKDISINLDIKLHVLFQRAFQLNQIQYIPYSKYLLSHRREGWRSDELNFIIDNRNEHRKGIARVLNRTSSSVSKQMYCLRLMCGGEQYDWSTRETDYLKGNASKKSVQELCAFLERHPIDVKHQCIEQGLWISKAGDEFKRGGTARRWAKVKQEEAAPCSI